LISTSRRPFSSRVVVEQMRNVGTAAPPGSRSI